MFYRRNYQVEKVDYTKDKSIVCRTCPFYEMPMVENDGPENAELMLVGDNPWVPEVQSGLPFQGPAGGILDVILEDVGIDRNAIRVSNAVKCKPPKLGEAYPAGVIETCVPNFLLKEIEKSKPKLIVPMGNTALAAFTGAKGITKVRGVVQAIEWQGHKLAILPTYHPSFINRNPSYAQYAAQDFKAVKFYIEHGHVQPENVDLDYRPVMSMTEFEAFFKLADKSKSFSWDLETTGLDWRTDEILCMSFSFAPKTAHVVMLYEFPVKNTPVKIEAAWKLHVINKIFNLLTSGKPIFFHNGKFDLRMLHTYFKKYLGKSFNIWNVNWYDTQAMYALIDENTKQSLKEVSKLHTDLRYSSEELRVVKGGQLKKLPLDKVVHYAGKDSDATRRIGLKFRKEIVRQGLWSVFKGNDYSDMEVANTLFDMELFGAPIDKEELVKLEKFLADKLERFRQRMIRSANKEIQKSYGSEELLTDDFNPRSPDQLRKVMFERLEFPAPEKRTKKGKISTDKTAIQFMIETNPDSKFMLALKYYREYDAIYKTFVKGFLEKLGEDDRLHPDFAFTRTVSGRVVCYKPNLANIPRDKEFEPGVFVSIRSLFVARTGWRIGYADLSQVEFKVAAILSGDKKMIHAMFEERDDFHSLVARGLYPGYQKSELLYKEALEGLKDTQISSKLREKLQDQLASAEIQLKTGRTRSKNFNFGRIYGAQKPTLAIALGLDPTDLSEIDVFIDRLAETYPDFEAYLKEIPEAAIRDGQLVSAFGRIRHFPASLDSQVQSEQGRKGGNFGPQSGAAFAMRAMLVRISQELKKQNLQTHQFNIVYDSNINEHPIEEEKIVAKIVSKEMLKPVPQLGNHVFGMEMGNGRSWKEAEHNAVKIFTIEDAKKYVASL